MDHNLGDPLNLESAMGVDFEHSEDVVVSQNDITLTQSSHDEGLPMEFEHIEEQPMLMDTGNEEIIDFMGEQFTLQEYSVQDDQMTGPTTTVEENQNLLTAQSDAMMNLQFEPQTMSMPAAGVLMQDGSTQPKYITVKAAASNPRISKKDIVIAPVTRPVAIAPKPPRLAQAVFQKVKPMPGKQFAIAPKPAGKPVSLMANRGVSLVKKMSLTGGVQSNAKGNTVLAQIGKQLVMMPAGGSQKIKLVTGSSGLPTVRLLGTSDSDQAQMIATSNVAASQPTKQVMAKVIVQGQQNADGSNQPAVLTKLMPVGSTGNTQPRFLTMQQKTIPISLGNKVLMASPTKQGVKFTRKQEIIAITKSPTTKILQGPSPQGTLTKKVVITGNSNQNLILKTAPPKAGQVNISDATGQRTQLHQINVPGKGIQYIRLVTNPSSAVKTTRKPAPGKTFVLTDNKGNLIQIPSEKMTSNQPPPLVVSSSTINKLTAKPQQKLVRIAPITSKTTHTTTMQPARSGQSLLAPLSPVQETHTQAPMLEEVVEPLASSNRTEEADECDDERRDDDNIEEEIDSKAALHALIADAVGDDSHSQGDMQSMHEVSHNVSEVEVEFDRTQVLASGIADTVGDDSHLQGDMQSMHDVSHNVSEVEVEFDRTQSSEPDDSNSMERQERAGRRDEHPLIVVPSFMKQDLDARPDSVHEHDESRSMDNMINLNVDVDVDYNTYQSPQTPHESESDLVATELGLRPRKACNCTKSQCLKLYCDCFANGEFCNRCNCNNCHNNLQNEELRQKAIRGCLDRNPNAFRPKIGKAKAGGADLIRRHNKGCNCKRSGCLKNYCECYEAKIACTAICKCVGCRNVEETLERARRRDAPAHRARSPPPLTPAKQPCSFMTTEVIEAVCQCLIAAAVESGDEPREERAPDPVHDVIEEFARCLQDIISASHQAEPLAMLSETNA